MLTEAEHSVDAGSFDGGADGERRSLTWASSFINGGGMTPAPAVPLQMSPKPPMAPIQMKPKPPMKKMTAPVQMSPKPPMTTRPPIQMSPEVPKMKMMKMKMKKMKMMKMKMMKMKKKQKKPPREHVQAYIYLPADHERCTTAPAPAPAPTRLPIEVHPATPLPPGICEETRIANEDFETKPRSGGWNASDPDPYDHSPEFTNFLGRFGQKKVIGKSYSLEAIKKEPTFLKVEFDFYEIDD
jgi:hypothetical protein